MKRIVLVGVPNVLLLILSSPVSADTISNAAPTTSDFTYGQTYTAQQLNIIVNHQEGFNPLIASNEDLKQYGYPQRPSDPAKLQYWKQVIQNAKEFVTPTFKIREPQNVGQPSSSLFSGNVAGGQSINWAGYVAKSSSVTSAIGQWAIPNVSVGPYSNQNLYYSSTWVGIGGVNTGNLIQAGTEQDFNENLLSATYYPWFEILPASQSEITNFPIQPGHTFYVDVEYSSINGGTVQFFLEDITTGQYTSFSKVNQSSYYDGSTAEWITERTQVSGSYPLLADTHTLTFTNCEAGVNGNGSQALKSFVPSPVTMYSTVQTSKVIESVTGISSDSTDFSTNFVATN